MSASPAQVLQDRLRAALETHQAGRLSEAQARYQDLLRAYPGHAEVLHLLGVVALQQGDHATAVDRIRQAIDIFDRSSTHHTNLGLALFHLGRHPEAVASCDRAIALDPGNAEAHLIRGNALRESGQTSESLAAFEQALAARPDHRDALLNRALLLNLDPRHDLALAAWEEFATRHPQDAEAEAGRADTLMKAGRHDEAIAAFERALALLPDEPRFLLGLGVALQAAHRPDEAIPAFERALAAQPDLPSAWVGIGACRSERGEREAAVQAFERAIAIDPGNADAHHRRGAVLIGLQRIEEALASYERALAIEPNHVAALTNRGSAMRQRGDLDTAIADLRAALARQPRLASIHNNLGSALYDAKQYDESLACFDRAIALRPDYADAYCNRGILLHLQGYNHAAIASFDEAIRLRPGYIRAHWNRALHHLRLGQFEPGWRDYEWRWKNTEIKLTPRGLREPLWLGDAPLQGKTILLHAEQGLGDSIQFCRFAPLVAALGARVLLEVPHALAGLLAQLEGVSEVIPRGSPLPPFDFQCPLMSLPLALGTRLDSIPHSTPYLTSDAKWQRPWSRMLGAHRKLRVGLAWSGRPSHGNDHNRSLNLQAVLDALPEGPQYVSLQKEVREQDLATLRDRPDVLHPGDDIADFRDTAALCDLVDLVVSVDTSVAHLAAAMGRPTWILLPFVPDWRWMLDRDDSPWYASVRLYRQPMRGDWETPLRRLAADLAGLRPGRPSQRASTGASARPV